MNRRSVSAGAVVRREKVIALHCSGAGASHWDRLAEALGPAYEVLVPEHYGSESSGAWSGEHAFTLADEAARTITLIDQSDDKVHLVGHSYGGGVALHVAVARPKRIASVALYEQSAIHLLRQMGESGADGATEIDTVARRMCESVITGDYRGGVARFVDYWNGPGAWNAMRPAAQKALIGWAPKGLLDFHALIDDTTEGHLPHLGIPDAPPARRERAEAKSHHFVEDLSRRLPNSRLMVIAGAGHMGPLTHASEVARPIVRHIVESRGDECPSVQNHDSLVRYLTPQHVGSAANAPIQTPDFSHRLSRPRSMTV